MAPLLLQRYTIASHEYMRCSPAYGRGPRCDRRRQLCVSMCCDLYYRGHEAYHQAIGMKPIMSGRHEAYHQAIGMKPTTQCVPWSRIRGRREAYNC